MCLPKETMMNVDDLVKYYDADNDFNLSQLINVAKSTVSKWRANGIPQETQAVLELLSDGNLKADLTDYPLKPKQTDEA